MSYKDQLPRFLHFKKLVEPHGNPHGWNLPSHKKVWIGKLIDTKSNGSWLVLSRFSLLKKPFILVLTLQDVLVGYLNSSLSPILQLFEPMVLVFFSVFKHH
jgi:hypothetical protein